MQNQSSFAVFNPTLGRLMSPEDVEFATRNRPDIPDELKRYWFLCGDIPRKFWNHLTSVAGNDDKVGFRLGGFMSTGKVA